MIKLIKNSLRTAITLGVGVSLVLNTVIFPQVLPGVYAAETITTIVESYSGLITDTSSVSPGLRVLPNTLINYYVDVVNNSTTTNLAFPRVTVAFASAADMDISARQCAYGVATTGTPRSSVTYSGPCGETPISPTTYEFEGAGGDLLPGQTIYFRITDIEVIAATGTVFSTITSEGLFSGSQSLTTDGPINSYVTTTTGTITGTVFYDNGTSSPPTQAENGTWDGADHVGAGIELSVTDTFFSTSGHLTASNGTFSITVPMNDLAGAPLSSPYTLTITVPSGYHVTTGSANINNIRIAGGLIHSGSLFGINNQTDLAVVSITTTPSGSSFISSTTPVFRYTVTNQSTINATNVVVAITLPSNGTISGSPVASAGSYASGSWTIPSLTAGSTETLDISILMGTPSGQSTVAEIMSMGTPPLPLTTPVSLSADSDSFPGTTIFEPEDDYLYFGFSIAAEPTISGVIYEDVNNNAAYNSEPGLVRTINLYNDDISPTTIMGTTTSASNGSYTFNSSNTVGNVVIQNGAHYHIEVLPVAGFNLTTGNMPQNIIASSGNVTASAIGYFAPASVSGRAFNDIDHNGIYNAGIDSVLSGVTVQLQTESTTLTTTTAAGTGIYNFNNVIAGSYIVRILSPTNYVPTLQNVGSDATDSDISGSNTTTSFAVTAGQVLTNIDGGFFNDASISGNVFQDFDYNSLDNSEAGMNDVVITLIDTDDGSTVASFTPTDNTGNYQFNGLVPGNYLVHFEPPTHFELVTYRIGVTNQANDSDVHPESGDSDPISLATGQDITELNAGVFNNIADLQISKSVRLGNDSTETSHNTAGPQVFPGTAITYFIDIANTSSATLTNLVVDDDFPSGISTSGWDCGYYVSTDSFTNHAGDYTSADCTLTGTGLINTASVLTPAKFMHIRLTGNVTPSAFGTYCNAAQAIADDIAVEENDLACFQVVSPNADLSLTKTVDPNQANIGENVVYTLNIVNNGPNTSTGAVVTDVLPSGLQFVSAEGDGVYNHTNGHWNIPSLLNGSGATLHITAEVTAAGVITNVATITTNLQPDDNTSDNEDSVPITGIAPTPTLTVLKSVQVGNGEESTDNTTGPRVGRGESLTYFIDVRNTTSRSISNLSIADTIPEGISSTGWTCRYDIGTNTLNDHTGAYATNCTLQSDGHITLPTTLASNSVIHVRLTGHTTPTTAGTYCNQALVVVQGITTPVSDAACFHIAAQAPASLQIVHTSNLATVLPGGQVTYTITVTNNGGSQATNVLLIDYLGNDLNNLIPSCVLSPSQITINNGGNFSVDNPHSIEWNLGNLAVGVSKTVSILANIRTDLASTTNCNTTASVSALDIPNTQAEVEIAVPVLVGAALVTLNKEAIDADTVFDPGDTIQYRMTVANTGNGASPELQLKDILPTNMLEWRNIQSSAGTITGGSALNVNNLVLAPNSSTVVTYTGVLKDSDAFSLRSWKLDRSAEKDDSDFYPEQVTRAKLTSTTHTDDQAALGAMDQQYVNLGPGGSIVLATSTKGKVLVDGDGDDFCLALGRSSNESKYRVSVAQVNQSSSYERLRNNGKNCYDISRTDLPWIRFIKVEDQSSGINTSVNLDAVCLLHVGGLIRNTATVEQGNTVLATDFQDIAVDFTDVFDGPVTASACAAPKQAQVLAPAPLPPPPVVIPTPPPLVLPKTGTDFAGILVLLTTLIVAGLWIRKTIGLDHRAKSRDQR